MSDLISIAEGDSFYVGENETLSVDAAENRGSWTVDGTLECSQITGSILGSGGNTVFVQPFLGEERLFDSRNEIAKLAAVALGVPAVLKKAA